MIFGFRGMDVEDEEAAVGVVEVEGEFEPADGVVDDGGGLGAFDGGLEPVSELADGVGGVNGEEEDPGSGLGLILGFPTDDELGLQVVVFIVFAVELKQGVNTSESLELGEAMDDPAHGFGGVGCFWVWSWVGCRGGLDARAGVGLEDD